MLTRGGRPTRGKRLASRIMLVVSMLALPIFGASRVGAAPTFQRASVSPDVERQMAISTEGEMISVIVRFRQQADVHRHRSGNRRARQQSLIDEMQTVADDTQGPMRSLLSIRQREGRIAKYQPLWVLNGVSVTAKREVIDELSRRPEVESISSDNTDVVPTTLPPVSATASADAAVIHAPDLWNLGFYGQGVVVADLDSGVDVTHPDLASSYRGGTNSWFDPYAQHTTPTDMTGHGTATTGIIVGGDSSGPTIGVAPGAKWIAAKIFNDAGTATATAIHLAMQWVLDPDGNPATDDAPQVVNNSWAYGNPGCNLQFQPDLQAMRAAGIIPVFAAGNYGPASASSVSPANYPEALAVGSTDNTDSIDPITSEGPSACGEPSTTYPDVVAPGYDIYSTDLHGFYQWGSGTSFAAPHVAGAIALLLSAQPGAGANVEAALEASAVDLGAPGADNVYGHGRIDVRAALQVLQTPPTTTTTTTTSPTTTSPTTTSTTTTTSPTTTTSTTTTTTVAALPPTVSGLTASPSAVNAAPVSISATVTASSARTVSRAEFFVDTVGAAGTGQAMTGTFGASSANVNATMSAAAIASLTDGNHAIAVRGQDSAGVWSAVATANVLIDRIGPTFNSLALTPSTSTAGGTTIVTATVSGASDGAGSGISGGEYWVGPNAPPTGSGTAFTGLAPVLPVSSPAPGSYTVSVRLRDVLGNWGTAHSATLTVNSATPSGFSDGFESGTLPGAWSSASTLNSTRLAVTANAALVGAFGLRAQGDNSNFVQYNVTSAAAVYDARFLFRPNGNTSSAQTIFSAATSSNFSTTVFRVRYRLSGSTPQVQIQLGTSTANNAWTNIAAGSVNNAVEVVWQAAKSVTAPRGSLKLMVNGLVVQSLGTSSTAPVAAVRLGSVSNGTSSIAEYFDAYASGYSAPSSALLLQQQVPRTRVPTAPSSIPSFTPRRR
jgi:subtilisin family serine protease